MLRSAKKMVSRLLVLTMVCSLFPTNVVLVRAENIIYENLVQDENDLTDLKEDNIDTLKQENDFTDAFAKSSELKSYKVNADDTVTFTYQGDGSESEIFLKGQFNNWSNVPMVKGENNVYSATLKVDAGIFEYDITVDNDIAYDSLSVTTSNIANDTKNTLLIKNPQVTSDGAIIIRYDSNNESDVSAELNYKIKDSLDDYKKVPMTKSTNETIYTSEIKEIAGLYEYYIDVAGTDTNDVSNPTLVKTGKALFTVQGLVADKFESQPGGNTTWRLIGDFEKANVGLGNWNGDDTTSEASENAKLKHLVGDYYAISIVLPAGVYEFKFVKNGSWDGAIGYNDGNFKIDLTEETKVNFYMNDSKGADGKDYFVGLDKIRTNLSTLTEQGIKQYDTSASSYSGPAVGKEPRLVGTILRGFGRDYDWAPDRAEDFFVDYYFDGTMFKLQRTFQKGDYEGKVVYGNDWGDINYGDGGSNLVLKILDASPVVFSTVYPKDDSIPKMLKHDYKPTDSTFDGMIDKSNVEFDSRSLVYKKPFGAVKQQSEDVTFRISTKVEDVQMANLELINAKDISKSYEMKVATVIGDREYWEVVIPKEAFDEIGIWGYKFILIDGKTKLEYGSSNGSGGVGVSTFEDGQTPYNLTVYAKDYVTPDWMKDAVVYQIFPDRFFDGDTTNNRAKTVDGYRGHIDQNTGNPVSDLLQYFDGGVDKDPTPEQVWGNWSDFPENPRQSTKENKPYYPDAKTDNLWTNEFYGGDIKGIELKLDYLKSLGVTAIYLNPVSWAASNHKYDATDYHHLDPMFGEPVYNTPGDPKSGLNYDATRIASDKVFQNFSKACDEKGIHLIADGVFNHVGDDSIYFDRYEKYPEIGAYEFWKRIWDEVNKTVPLVYDMNLYPSKEEHSAALANAKINATNTVKNYYKSLINPATNANYTDADFSYINWFTIRPEKGSADDLEFPNTYKYNAWWGYSSLPEIDTVEASSTNLSNDSNATIAGPHEYNNVDYRNKVIGYDIKDLTGAAATTAMETANSQRWLWMGTSGWRLDVAPDVTKETWVEFRKSLKSTIGKIDVNGKQIEDPVIIGEEWGVATHYLLGDQFDSVMNYQFRSALQAFLISGNAELFNKSLETIRENYPKESWEAMLNLVDSHDTVRNITKIDFPGWEEENTKIAPAASDRALKLQALTAIFQMGYPGAPTIYYGDEVGVVGTKDPDSRRTFPWDRIVESGGSYSATGEFQTLFDIYTKAANTRNENGNLFSTGDIKMAYAKDDVIAYARKNDTKGGLVAINRSAIDITIDANILDFLPEGIQLKDMLGSSTTSTVSSGKLSISIPAYSGVMMVSTSDFSSMPEAPQDLVAEAQIGVVPSVNLTWAPVSGATSYEVYRTLLEGTETEKIGDAADSSYTDNSVVNGTRYYYYVKSLKDGQKSLYSNFATALPSFKIESVSKPTDIQDMTIKLGSKTDITNVEIKIPGLTDDPAFKDLEVPNLIFKLVYQLKDEATSKEVKLRYLKDTDDNSAKVYYASFEPTEVGIFEYYAKASTDKGATFTTSDYNEMNAIQGPVSSVEKPVLSNILEESNRVTLNWSVEDSNIAGFDIYRTIGNTEIKIDTVDKEDRVYTDYAVNNDTQYTYRVAAFDINYNRTFSESKTVTPKLVMIDVTFRLHMPDYTPPTDDIYIASGLNGWNSSGWRMTTPSGATKRDVVEYNFKMLAGKTADYKYTRGPWSTEALTSRTLNDTTSPGNYAYSSTDTNINFKAVNQGGNRMMVDDYVLRWVDMPMMISIPRTSYFSEDIVYTTSESTFDLKASVPYGVKFTMNGVDINSIKAGAMDSFGNVKYDNIPLEIGLNEIVLHIEPTEETLNQPWYLDKGRAGQATATTTLKITRTESGLLSDCDVLSLVTPINATVLGTNISATVENGVVSQLVEANVNEGATWKLYSDIDCATEILNNTMSLKVGDNTSYIKVTAQDGITSKIYTLNVKVLDAIVVPDKSELEKELLYTTNFNFSLYTYISSIPYREAIVFAKNIFEKQDATLKEIQDAVGMLINAKSKLVKIQEDYSSGSSSRSSSSTPSPTPTPKPTPIPTEKVTEPEKDKTPLGNTDKNNVLTSPNYNISLSKSNEDSFISGYDDGTFKPNATMTLAEISTILYNLSINVDKDTTKTKGNMWYEKPIAFLENKGLLSKNSDPKKELTRGDMAILLASFVDTKDLKITKKFSDTAGNEAERAINILLSKGIVEGYEDSTFRPDKKISRAEVVILINRLLERKNQTETVNNLKQQFTDIPKTHWAYNEIMSAVKK